MSKASRRWLGVLGAGLVLAIGSGTGLAAEVGAGGAGTTRVSVSSGEAQANGGSHSSAISAHGRFVAFESDSANLVKRDTNGRSDVFIRDRKRGTTRRLSVSSKGGQANGDSFMPAISADGRFVAFVSEARNLIARPDDRRRPSIFVHDRRTHRTSLVSVTLERERGPANSLYPAISADGRFVAFASEAENLVRGDRNGDRDIFVRDLKTRRTRLVSIGLNGADAHGGSYAPSISASGRFVAFHSHASNLVKGDRHRSDVFVRDLMSGRTRRVSVGLNRTKPNDISVRPSISADGRLVAFESLASNLVEGDTTHDREVFVRDLESGETRRVSLGSNGAEPNASSRRPSISAGGLFVAFGSRASNLVGGDINDARDVFVRDLRSDEARLVSIGLGQAEADGGSGGPAISADGRFVAFASPAGNLVRGDSNRVLDVFVRGPLR
jgi:Tol biopolymer transport system component